MVEKKNIAKIKKQKERVQSKKIAQKKRLKKIFKKIVG